MYSVISVLPKTRDLPEPNGAWQVPPMYSDSADSGYICLYRHYPGKWLRFAGLSLKTQSIHIITDIIYPEQIRTQAHCFIIMLRGATIFPYHEIQTRCFEMKRSLTGLIFSRLIAVSILSHRFIKFLPDKITVCPPFYPPYLPLLRNGRHSPSHQKRNAAADRRICIFFFLISATFYQ